jgi:hypothetical protein
MYRPYTCRVLLTMCLTRNHDTTVPIAPMQYWQIFMFKVFSTR